MRTVLIASMRVHLRRYVAAILAVTIGAAFIVVTGAIAAAAREGMLAGISAPFEHADHVANASDDGYLTGDQTAALVAQVGTPASVLGWTVQTMTKDGIKLEDRTDLGALADDALRWQELESGRFPAGPGEGVVESYVARSDGIAIGDRLTFGSGTDALEVTVVGLVDSPSAIFAASAYVLWPDLSRFQNTLNVQAVAWAGPDVAVPDVQIRSSAEYVEWVQVAANSNVDVLAIVLLLFGAIALFVSALVIANTFSILFAARRRDLALLRCVGATRKQVQRAIRAEALALGVGSALVGLGVGLALGYGIVALIGALAPQTPLGSAMPAPGWFAAAFASGVLVTLVAAWLPTRNAVRVSPLAALRPDEQVDVRTAAGRLRIAAGVGAVIGGVVLLGGAIVTSSYAVMTVGGGVAFLGVLLLGPVLIPAAVRALGAVTGRFGPASRLATGNAVRHPRRTAATAAALIVGVTLTTAVLTGMASGRSAIETEMSHQHPIDLALTVPGDGDELASAVRELSGVADVAEVPGVVARIEGLNLTVLAPGDSAIPRADTVRPVAGAILLPYDLVGDALRDGDTVSVSVGEHTVSARVILGDGWGNAGLISPDLLAQLTDSAGAHAVWVRAVGGADPDDLGAELETLARPLDGEVENGLAARAWVDTQLNVLVTAVVGLLGISVVIALFGIGNTLGLSVLERARENALLRALGFTRRQLRSMLAFEAVLLSVVATVVGLTVGVSFAWVGVEVLIDSVVPGAPTILPFDQVTIVVLVAALAGLAASVLPATRAARTPPAAGLAVE